MVGATVDRRTVIKSGAAAASAGLLPRSAFSATAPRKGGSHRLGQQRQSERVQVRIGGRHVHAQRRRFRVDAEVVRAPTGTFMENHQARSAQRQRDQHEDAEEDRLETRELS